MRLTATTLPAILFAASLAAPAAHAARPLNTDDANIVDAKSCQLESWVRSQRDHLERWAIPGCNPFGEAEFSVGGSRQSDAAAGSSSSNVVQAKFRLRPVTPDGWGLSATVGSSRYNGDALTPAQRDNYLNVPLTLSLGKDRYLHFNAGWVHHLATRQGRATWGVATEIPVGGPAIAVAEAYGEQGTQARFQLGMRFWVVPQRVQIDTTVGDSFSQPRARWVSIGLRLLSPAFLP